MTPTARTVLPTDLVALVSYDGRVYANEAMTLDRIGTHDSPHPLETAFEQWFSFATGRHTWISVKGPTLRGLASARKRGSKLVWEIDCLINAEESGDGVLLSLLDQVTEAAGRSGALRIFVRLPGGSTTEDGASRCAFAPYRHEQVYRRDIDEPEKFDVPEGLRRRGKSDLYPVFQLYNAEVPANIRRYEAATFAEWTATIEHIGRATQYVYERDGRVVGWLRVAGDGDIGRFDLLGYPEALDDLIDAALAKLSNRRSAYVLVPQYQAGLRERLEARGFQAGDEFTTLSRRTVHPVKEARTAPAVVRTTFG
ncbi:MAG TPA: hypothetical protein VIH21_12405 [Dehalococcoidia bacterium]|jgi:hypothetical protein